MKPLPAAAAAAAAVRPCHDMTEVRHAIDALDDAIVPLLVRRVGYMTQAARIKPDAALVRDPARIEAIARRVRARAAAEGAPPALTGVVEAIYRSLMEACIAFEQREFTRLHTGALPAKPAHAPEDAAP